MSSALVIGAGPVGLTLAAELTRFGVSVRIVDHAPARSDKSKALAVWPRTLELLERAGLAEPFIAAGLRCERANILAGEEHVASISFGELATSYPFLLSIPQSETERLLDEHLATLGVTVERSIELEGFADEGDYVTCTLRHAGGEAEIARADWLLGCDGARSTIRSALKLDFAGDTLPENFVLADVHVSGLSVPRDELGILWSPSGGAIFLPMKSGYTRIIADVGTEPRHDPTLAEIQAIVDARAPGVTVSDPIWLSGFSINERMVPTYRVGRAFVAGDAAHIHSPAGGQGMNTGMHDAINLAWKLALVQRGLAGPGILDSYSPERSGVAKQILADSGRLTRVGILRSHLAQEMRNFVVHTLLGFRTIREEGAARMAELTIHYPESPLNRGAARGLKGPAPGDRIVAGAPFGTGATPRFALLSDDSPEARAVLERHAAIIEPSLRPPLADGMIRLVRPDGYVAVLARPGEWALVEDCLSSIAAHPSPVAR